MTAATIDTSIIDNYNTDHADSPFLGRIAWYSVRDVPVPHDTIKNELDAAGLAEFTPRRPGDTDIFRRVTKAGEANIPQPDGTVAKVMVRDVASDKERILRRVVVETVDENDARLDYAEVFDLEYRRKEKRFVTTRLTWSETPADGAVVEMQQKFAHWIAVGMHGSESLRTVLKRALEENHGVLVRPTGGVYFMPRTNDDALHKASAFASVLEQVSLHTLPLVDTPDQVQMVSEGVSSASTRAADEMMKDLAAMLKAGEAVSESKLARIVTQSKQIRDRLSSYKDLLGEELSGAGDRLGVLDQQVQACLLKMRTEGAA